MPATRLKPLPFTEPERLARWIEEDPSLLESGLRIVGRHVPLPASGGSLLADLLAIDRHGRPAVVFIGESIGARALEAALAARGWLRQSLPALRTLCPALAEATYETRAILIGGRVEEATDLIAAGLSTLRLEIFRASVFETASGAAISLEPAYGPAWPSEPAATGAEAPAASGAEAAADPLAGIPLTSEEVEEFRRLASTHVARAAKILTGGEIPRKIADSPAPAILVEN